MDHSCRICRRFIPANAGACPGCGRVSTNGRASKGAPASRSALSDPRLSGPASASSAEIDLGSPVTGNYTGPPSGGSRIGWAALIHARQTAQEAGTATPVEFDPFPLSCLTLPEPRVAWPASHPSLPSLRRARLEGVLLGLLLGGLLCLGLWSAGLEPPLAFRHWAGSWLGRPAATVEDGPPQPGPSKHADNEEP